jgi:hypothetical protein
LEIYYEFRTASIYNASHTDVRTGGPISISRDFEVGRTYILQGFPEGDKFGPVRLSIVPIADNASPNIQELPKVEKLPNSGVRYTTLGRTVYDTKTKLTWQQTVSSKMYTWAESQTYCASVGMDLGGAGWRLPTLKELETIVDHSQSNPSIDATAFPSTPKDRFWSSSPVARSSLNAWAIFFDSGQAYSFAQSLTGYVRCVR